jgi:integrase
VKLSAEISKHTGPELVAVSNARRNVSMTGRVKAILSARHIAAGKPNSGFVFVRRGKAMDKSAVPYSTIDTQHDRVLKDMEFRFRIYDFRHTFLTRLGQSGADAFTIMRVAGHGSIAISQRYVHPTPERLESAVANLEAYNRRQSQRQRRKSA